MQRPRNIEDGKKKQERRCNMMKEIMCQLVAVDLERLAEAAKYSLELKELVLNWKRDCNSINHLNCDFIEARRK